MKIDLDNIEHLFGLVEMRQRLKSSNPQTRDSTIYLIAKTLELALDPKHHRPRIGFQLNTKVGDGSSFPASIEKDPTNARYFADIYDFFAGLVAGCYDHQEKRPSRDSVIITFNYDLVLDHALWRLGIPPEYNLPEAELDWPTQTPTVPVLKLHGSTNWVVCQNCKHIRVLGSKATESSLGFRSGICNKCQQSRSQLLLVPPSWDKTEYQTLIRPVWEKASEALNTATRICIIGYSMPEADAFFRYLLTLGLADNHRLYKLIVVNRQDFIQTPRGLFPEEQTRCALDDFLRAGHNDATPTIEKKYRDLFESTFAQRRFSFHGNGLELYLGNGEAFPELGRGELVQNIHLY